MTTQGSALDKSREQALCVDGDEEAAAAGQDFILFVENFGHIDVLAAVDLDLARFDTQRLMERHWLQILHGHFGRERDHLVQLVHLAHGFVEDGGDDAAVAVSGGAGVALAQAKAADETIALFIVGEAQAHAFGIVLAAGEAIIFLQF